MLLAAPLLAPSRAAGSVGIIGGDDLAGGPEPGQGYGEDFYLTVEPENWSPHVNERMLVSLRAHTIYPPLGSKWESPESRDFSAYGASPPRYIEEEIGGRQYFIMESKLVMFPLRDGELKIPPAGVKILVMMPVGGSGQISKQWVDVRSKPVPVGVRRLPRAGRPRGFDGAVGSYSLSAKLEEEEVRLREMTTLAIRIKGRGNVKGLGKLSLPKMPGFRPPSPVFSHKVSPNLLDIRGEGTFRIPLRPMKAGTLRIPPISFHFYDPSIDAYSTLSTLEFSLLALPSKTGETEIKDEPKTPPSGTAKLSAPDWTDLKTLIGKWRGSAWIAAVPVGLVFLLLIGRRLTRGAKTRAAADRRSDALGTALRAVQTSLSEPSPGKALEKLAEVPARYAADRLGCAPGSLTPAEAYDRLAEAYSDLSWENLAGFRKCWEELVQRRGASGAARAADVRILAIRLREVLRAMGK